MGDIATIPANGVSDHGSLDQLQALAPAVSILPDKAVDWVAPLLKNPMATDQTAALLGLLQHPVSVVWWPWNREDIHVACLGEDFSQETDRIVCMAPTGKAAKRLGIKWAAGIHHSCHDGI